jgi:hypothetical protein
MNKDEASAIPCPYVVSTREGTHYCSLSQRQPLTDEQIGKIPFALFDPERGMSASEALHLFARAIEAAHGIGEKK